MNKKYASLYTLLIALLIYVIVLSYGSYSEIKLSKEQETRVVRLPHEEPDDEIKRIRKILLEDNHYKQKDCASKKPTRYHSQDGEDLSLYKKFFSNPQLCNGTFIELGALEGVMFSNTLMYERDLGWTGVLVEGAPSNFKKLTVNRPKTNKHNCAVCKEGQESVHFVDNGIHPAMRGALKELKESYTKRKVSSGNAVEVKCCSLGEKVRLHGVRHVDFAVVDVEGSEMYALGSYDWSIPIHVLVIEMCVHQKEIEEFVNSKGYFAPEAWKVCERKDGCHCSRAFINRYWPS